MDKLPNECALRLLDEFHEFPGVYTFKVIGPDTPAWRARIEGAVCAVLGENLRGSQVRTSRPGAKWQSLSLEAWVESSDQVLAVYAALRQVDGVKMLI